MTWLTKDSSEFKRVMRAARHLTAWQLAKTNPRPGVDYRRCSKSTIILDLLNPRFLTGGTPYSAESLVYLFESAANPDGEMGLSADTIERARREAAHCRLFISQMEERGVKGPYGKLWKEMCRAKARANGLERGIKAYEGRAGCV